jgi:hypothetical protein
MGGLSGLRLALTRAARSAEFVDVVERFLRDGVVTFSTLMSRLTASA